MEELAWIRRLVAHQAEHTFIHSIKGDLTTRDSFAFVIRDRSRNGEGLGGLHFGLGGIDGDRQFLGM